MVNNVLYNAFSLQTKLPDGFFLSPQLQQILFNDLIRCKSQFLWAFTTSDASLRVPIVFQYQ